MSDEVVLLDVADGTATVMLNRPEARNALSRDVLRVLPRIVRECDTRDDVRVVIITGADPAFCAGLDLKELGSDDRRGGGLAEAPTEPHGPLPQISKPIIGAINGAAITGGFELALNCDFLVASDRGTIRGHAHPRRDSARLGAHRPAPRSGRCPAGA